MNALIPIRFSVQGKRSPKGFTLVEMVVVLVLLAILTGVGGPFLATVVDAIGFHVDRVDLEESANLTLSRMSREIRRLRNDASVVTAGAADFEFVNRDNVQIRYRLVGNTLTRTQAGVDSGLADQMQAAGLSFTYYDDAGTVLATPAVGLGTNTNLRRIQVQTVFQHGSHVVTERLQVRPPNLRHESERFG